MPAGTGTYTVYVDDNFHYMDEGDRYCVGSFADCASAQAACRSIVDDFLAKHYRSNMSADELLEQYRSFGDDPWIASENKDCTFSAWSYAEARVKELCT